jgi:hypothetical protein
MTQGEDQACHPVMAQPARSAEGSFLPRSTRIGLRGKGSHGSILLKKSLAAVTRC